MKVFFLLISFLMWTNSSVCTTNINYERRITILLLAFQMLCFASFTSRFFFVGSDVCLSLTFKLSWSDDVQVFGGSLFEGEREAINNALRRLAARPVPWGPHPSRTLKPFFSYFVSSLLFIPPHSSTPSLLILFTSFLTLSLPIMLSLFLLPFPLLSSLT